MKWIRKFNESNDLTLDDLKDKLYYLEIELEDLNNEIKEVKNKITIKEQEVKSKIISKLNKDIYLLNDEQLEFFYTTDKDTFITKFSKIEFSEDECYILSTNHLDDQAIKEIEILIRIGLTIWIYGEYSNYDYSIHKDMRSGSIIAYLEWSEETYHETVKDAVNAILSEETSKDDY
jgi:hypothetical protein